MIAHARVMTPTMEVYMEDDSVHSGAEALIGDVVDLAKLGRLLRGGRIIAGFPGGPEFVAAIERTTGLMMSKTVLYNIETGAKDTTLQEVMAIVATLGLPDAWDTYVIPAVKPEVVDAIRRTEPRR